MADPIRIYNLDEIGLLVDRNLLVTPKNALLKAQNAVTTRGEGGSLRKRAGLKQFNAIAGTGSVQGGVGIPILLGSAGTNFQNPFADPNILIATYTQSILPVPSSLGGTFDDLSLDYPFDWNFDFGALDELNYLGFLNQFDPNWSSLDVDATLAISGVSTPSHTYAVTLLGNDLFNSDAGTAYWFDSLTTTVSQAANNLTNYTNTKSLIFPLGKPNPIGTGNHGASRFLFDNWYVNSGLVPNLEGRPSCVLNNILYYAEGSYTVGTDPAPVFAYTGFEDRSIAKIGSIQGFVTLLAANSVIYCSTYDSGINNTGGGTIVGSVYSLNPSTLAFQKLGSAFPTGHMPYSLVWAYGRLWCGTVVLSDGDTTAGRIYYIRPGIDTAWTLDKTFAASEHGVSGLALFKGLIYASTMFGNGASGKVYVRGLDGTYTASYTNASFPVTALTVWPQENTVSSPASALYAVVTNEGANTRIEQFNGSSWTEVYANATTYVCDDLGIAYATNPSTNKNVPVLWTVHAGSVILNTIDGTTWVDRSASFPSLGGNIQWNGIVAGLILQV